MTVTNGYCTVSELKSWDGVPDTDGDAILETVINSVSRWIDDYTWRFFYSTSATAEETRYYTADNGLYLYTDDIVSITTLKTDDDGDRTYETTWATADYDLIPYNASTLGIPYYRIEVSTTGDYTFPRVRKGVEIVGVFGWSAVPPAIKQACLIQCARIFKRKNSPYGIAGTTQLGVLQLIPNIDSDVKMVLDQFKRVHT